MIASGASLQLKSVATILVISTLVNLANCIAHDHCYSDIGCFPLSAEFYHPEHRPFNVRPWHRSRIKIRFELYSKKYPHGYYLQPWDKLSLLGSRFDPNLETKIIIPGWLDNIKRALWVKRLKDALLWRWHPVNIIVVHWRNFTPYTTATANTRVVGAELANLLRFIEVTFNYDRAYHHLIGHSLGAHIGGYCGDRLPGLGRITALDPARPFFQHMPKSVRLDRGDARFVDAIHSDFTPENAIFLLMSFGMTTPVGHADFYPNGPPLLQAGCLRDTLLSVRNGIARGLEHSSLAIAFLEAIRYLTACDHQRAHEWFVESITNRQCLFVGVRCNEFDGLINGRCSCDDSRSACAIMGIHADQMYLNDAHEDLWPIQRSHKNQFRSHRRPAAPAHVRPSIAPSLVPFSDRPIDVFFSSPHEQMPAPQQGRKQNYHHHQQQQFLKPTKDQLYSELRHHSQQLRHRLPPMIPDELFENFDDIQDAAFVQYLRDTLLRGPAEAANENHYHHVEPPIQRPRPQQPTDQPDHLEAYNSDEEEDMVDIVERRDVLAKRSSRQQFIDDDYDGDDDVGSEEVAGLDDSPQLTVGDFVLLNAINQHPRLLSDLDRDIESWYENTSRWYLKTNNRPAYCVNQYQLLVYLGPLKTSSSRKSIRANLVISIIGSRGQLMNQRFIPRSANLDSFTMQPFFILLEGSYSLGNILAVAIAWEARVDPDPIQATVSFQSNLLENMQSVMPTYRAKHPWLSETLKYDYSNAFRWRPPALLGSNQIGRRKSHDSFKRRSSAFSDQSEHEHEQQRDELSEHSMNQRCSNDNQQQCSPAAINPPDPGGAYSEQQLAAAVAEMEELLAAGSSQHASSLIDFDRQQQALELDHHFSQSLLRPTLSVAQNNVLSQQVNHRVELALPKPPPADHNFLDQAALFAASHADMSQITAKLHNIAMHSDTDTEDSIVVNQVIVSPLQANYGKDKLSKAFCSPHPNFRLRRDQTVRLEPNLMGRCLHSPGRLRQH